jgi:cytochrome oxidase Cu insertion factor (SCO1/SenC/PrrC family)
MRPLLNEQKDLYEQLRKMLTLADLVKFAKWTATPDENEMSLRNAYVFVKETTPTIEEPSSEYSV